MVHRAQIFVWYNPPPRQPDICTAKEIKLSQYYKKLENFYFVAISYTNSMRHYLQSKIHNISLIKKALLFVCLLIY